MEKVAFLDAFEDRSFDFNELVGEQQREETVGIGVYGYVKRDDLVEECRGVQGVVD